VILVIQDCLRRILRLCETDQRHALSLSSTTPCSSTFIPLMMDARRCPRVEYFPLTPFYHHVKDPISLPN
jgi:hypothetical protein